MPLDHLLYYILKQKEPAPMRRLLKGLQFWPEHQNRLPVAKVVSMYHQGFAGAFEDKEDQEVFDETLKATSKFKNGDDLVHAQDFADMGKGKLTVLFTAVTECYGYEALTRPGQETGDCVSMMGRDVSLYTCCVDAVSKTADEKTGKVEGVPQVSDLARKNGVFANEGIYKNRMHNGQGMSCDQAMNWIMTKGGVVVRADYTEAGGANLEEYNVKFELKGSQGSPEWLNSKGREHQIRSGVRLRSHEEVRDVLAGAKAAIGVCSSLGFSRTRDENGYSKRSGSWGHSWHIIGYDDRPETIAIYGFPLALFGHRWGPWNSGPRRIRGTNIDIPEGYAWIDARLLNQCWLCAFNSLSGWPQKELPPIETVLG